MYELPFSGMGYYSSARRQWFCQIPLRVLQLYTLNEIRRVAPLTDKEDEIHEYLTVIEQVIDEKKVKKGSLPHDLEHVFFYHYSLSTTYVMFAVTNLVKTVKIGYQRHAINRMNFLYNYIDSAIQYCTHPTYATSVADQDRRMSLYMPINQWELRWLTRTTRDLACVIYDEKRWELCPVLADALMDAGCSSEQVLGQLQYHWQSMGRGVWIIDHLTGRR